jgi:hypothetical protein
LFRGLFLLFVLCCPSAERSLLLLGEAGMRVQHRLPRVDNTRIVIYHELSQKRTIMLLKKMAMIGIPAIALALGASGGAQAANLVLNGDFSLTNSTFHAGDKASFSGLVTDWSGGANLTFLASPGTAVNGPVPVYGPFPNSPSGGNFVEADGDPSFSGVIEQRITGLTVGQIYAVSFSQAAGQQTGFTGATHEQWAVGLGTTLALSESSAQLSHQMTLPGPNGPGGAAADVYPWESQTLMFTATATSEVLSFLAVGGPNTNNLPPISFLDGVSMNAVPEPSAVILFGSGLLGMAAFSIRQRMYINRNGRKPAAV